jgi:hypothetical protein
VPGAEVPQKVGWRVVAGWRGEIPRHSPDRVHQNLHERHFELRKRGGMNPPIQPQGPS